MGKRTKLRVSSFAIACPGNTLSTWRSCGHRFGVLTAMLSVMSVSVALIFFTASAFAEGASVIESAAALIEGTVTVVGPQGSEAVPGVTVELTSGTSVHQSLSVSTDADGRYQFSNLAPGDYSLRVTLDGFKPFGETIALKPREDKVEIITLELATVVQKVEVHDKPSAVPTQGAESMSTISARQFTTLPLADQKFKTVLPLVPGVVRTPDGKLNMKGAAENQGMLLVDSAQTVDPVTGSFSIPIPLDAVQTLRVDKEPYGAQYGGFSGGLTTIETKPPANRWNFGVMDFIPGFRGKMVIS